MGFGLSLVIGLWLIHKGTRQITSTLWVPRVFGLPSLREDTSFGLLVFTPKQLKFFMKPRLPKSYERFFFGLLVFTPKQPQLYMEITTPWFYGILFGLQYWLASGEIMSVQMDKGAPKRLSLFVKWRGESSVHSKKECFKVVSTGRRSRVALHPLASLHRH